MKSYVKPQLEIASYEEDVVRTSATYTWAEDWEGEENVFGQY